VQFQLTALHGTTAIKRLVTWEIEHGQVTAAERMQVTHGVPHRASRQVPLLLANQSYLLR
jgi:hypothetical protein